MDSHLIKNGGWIFEITQLRARRVENFGDEYNGIATVTITDGVAHVEGLLCKPPEFKRDDFKVFTTLLVDKWGLDLEYHRRKNNVKKHESVLAKEKTVTYLKN